MTIEELFEYLTFVPKSYDVILYTDIESEKEYENWTFSHVNRMKIEQKFDEFMKAGACS